MNEDASVGEGGFAEDVEVGVEGFAEGSFGEVGVDGFASAEEFLEFGVGGWHPFDDEVAGGDTAAEGGDVGQRDLCAEEEVMDDGEHEDGVEVSGAAGEEGWVLMVAPAGGWGGVGEVDAEGEDVGGVGDEAGGESIDGLEVGVDGDDVGSGLGGEAGVDAGVAADVEELRGAGGGEGGGDEGLFACVIFVGVVVGGFGVVGPGGCAVFGGDAAHVVEQAGKGFAEDVGGEGGVGGFAGWCGGGCGVGFAAEEDGEGDGGECGLAEAGEERECLVDVFGLVSVTVGEGGVERPAELGVGEHGEEKHADKLSVGEPDGVGEIGRLDGEEVDEDGLRALKEDVEGGGVFEDPAFVDEFGGEAEGEFGGAEPECGWPLPGVGDEVDAWVAEAECCVWVGVGEDFGGDEALLLG